jgi:glucose-1-phosphate thymidylyltransferase
VKNSVVHSSLVQQNTLIENVVIGNSMLGSHVKYQGHVSDLSIGDYTQVKL